LKGESQLCKKFLLDEKLKRELLFFFNYVAKTLLRVNASLVFQF
jgi:hypothetical protein